MPHLCDRENGEHFIYLQEYFCVREVVRDGKLCFDVRQCLVIEQYWQAAR